MKQQDNPPNKQALSSRDCTILQTNDETGQVLLTDYRVFPGIHLIYKEVHAQSYQADWLPAEGQLVIDHCQEGRMECVYGDHFFYLAPGDLSISLSRDRRQEPYFPHRHYHGISIVIDAQQAPQCLDCILDDINVRPSMLQKKFCTNNDFFVMRSRPWLEHIFSELYSVPDSIKKGYLKIKILELLLFLSSLPKTVPKELPRYSPSQVLLAKKICQYLTQHMNTRITIAELAEIFHVSPTLLKNSFKGVYGVSVYAYIRAQKMQSAALMLRQTDLTILDIAGQYGYDNGSKFAKAFKDTMGVTPHQYRSLQQRKG